MSEFTALENVMMPALIAGESSALSGELAKKLLDYMGLSERMTHFPAQLSGGEQQRVAVARALINQPKLILADEPTGNLDSANSRQLFDLFTQLAAEKGVAFLIATHNEEFAQAAPRCIRMADGKIV